MNTCVLKLVCAAYGLCCVPLTSHCAEVLSPLIPNTIGGSSAGDNTLGYSFTVNSSPLQATALGMWDSDLAGLVNAHEVGLWTDGGTLLRTVTLSSGMSGRQVGEFRFLDLVSPVLLDPGHTYVVGVHYLSSDLDAVAIYNSGTPAPIHPATTAGNWRFVENAGFTFPTSALSGGAVIGPNLEFAVVPEPGTLALLGLLGGFALVKCASGGAGRRRPVT